ncbi:MAG: YbaK/EbsC family protein [Clostridia bacterium]|nr:YbaK/EbsC family protein [Clostridia bacterium]
MSVQKVKQYLAQFGADDKVMQFDQSSATVELAAVAVGVIPARIAKTLSFKKSVEQKAILIVAAGDVKVDNAKFKKFFGYKAKMLVAEEVEELTGYRIGGVCPFDNPDGTDVYLDVSLQRFDVVYPACGSDNSAIPLTLDELYQYSKAKEWIDVCKIKE